MKTSFLKFLSVATVIVFVLTACAPTATEESVTVPTSVPKATEEAVTVPTSVPKATEEAVSVPTSLPAEQVTLIFHCWEGDLGTYDDVMSDLITPFIEETGINVDYEVAPWADYWVKFNTLATSHQLPDVFCESVAYTSDHAANGLLADLTALETKLGDNYFWDEVSHNLGSRYPDANGTLYAVPFREAGEVLFYNKDIFDTAGVAYPTNDWTYDDLVAAAQLLTKDLDGDGTIDQYGISLDGLYITHDTYVKANGGLIVNPEHTECLANSTIGIQALQDEVKWIQELHISPIPGGLDFQGAYPFATGKFAMYLDITPSFNYLLDVPFKWDIVLPPIGDVSRKIYGGQDPLAISAFTEHPAEAQQLLEYILSEKVQSNPKITGTGSIPFEKTVAYSDDFLNGRGYPANLKDLLDHFADLVDADFGSKWIEWRLGAMDPEIKAALLGTKSPEDALDAACGAVDAIFANP
jgi:multiple sugar transport system substrate-binding protein